VLGLIIGGVIGYFTPHPQSDIPIVISTPALDPTLRPTSTPTPVRVYVSGAVHRPEVYQLPPGSIVKDAVDAAGGAVQDADLDRINLAVELRDQQQVHVPFWGEEGVPSQLDPGAETGAGLVDINVASASELESLPGIGPAMAQKIVSYRETNGPFETVADIVNVPGIGQAKYDGLKDFATVNR
jgi:competence protein ComEA